tara:strand:+ start:576 stop:1001 length:426 start_codon:yes stop_codon:yes gene_type:complete
MITQFDKLTLKKIRELLENQLNNSIENIEIKVGNCSYEDTNCTFKINLHIKGTDTSEMADLKKYANLYNIDLSRTHDKYELVGFRTKASKRPFIVKNKIDNKRFIFTEEQAKKYWGSLDSVMNDKLTLTEVPIPQKENENE